VLQRKEASVMRRTRMGVAAVKAGLLAGAVLAATLSMSPIAAEDLPLVRGVRIDCGDIEPRLVGVVGQLTLNGDPIPGTMFALLCHEEQILDIRYFLNSDLREKVLSERSIKIRRAVQELRLEELGIARDDIGIRANGAELAFVRGARGIVVAHLSADDFQIGKPYLLLAQGVEDPPGEASVAFF
jgi:hypothetical protein